MEREGFSRATPDVRRFPTLDALHAAAAGVIVRAARDSVSDRGIFSVALAGGSTPRRAYERLAAPDLRDALPWRHTHVFWGDERHVPPDHPESNYRMADESLLSHVPIPPAHVHRIRAEQPDAAQAAAEYETELRATLGSPGAVPCLDLVLLGLGADGHTASLFPGSDALREPTRLVVETWVPTLGAHRITMTLPLLNAARQVAFLVAGAEKAGAVCDALAPSDAAHPVPARLVRPDHGHLLWLLDDEAAHRLPR
jgi:6-phosphogluconolactonase